jgi:hypothetical protein
MRAQGIIGSALMAIGGLCPLVHVTFIGNWNYFQVDTSLGIIFYIIVMLGLAGSLLNKTGMMRTAGWAGISMVVLTLAAVWLKTHSAFSFLHFKKLINVASHLVSYKWGWFIILAGALILVIVRKKSLKQAVTVTEL